MDKRTKTWIEFAFFAALGLCLSIDAATSSWWPLYTAFSVYAYIRASQKWKEL